MKEQKAREDYDNDYEYRREHLWKTLSQQDDIGYENTISFFRRRKQGEQPVSGKVNVPVEARETPYDKSYELPLVIRLVKEKMMTKRLTRLPSGQKKRLTMRKDYLEMAEYDKYTWIALINEIRFAIHNGDDSVLLSNEEIRLIS